MKSCLFSDLYTYKNEVSLIAKNAMPLVWIIIVKNKVSGFGFSMIFPSMDEAWFHIESAKSRDEIHYVVVEGTAPLNLRHEFRF